jgi:hypothetical protein
MAPSSGSPNDVVNVLPAADLDLGLGLGMDPAVAYSQTHRLAHRDLVGFLDPHRYYGRVDLPHRRR